MQLTNLQNGETYFAHKNQNFVEFLRGNGLFLSAPCGGKGICGKCRVQILPTDMPISAQDAECFTPEQLQEGFRLACTLAVTKDFSFRLPEEASFTARILRKTNDAHCMLAVDIGTTTIEMALLDKNGDLLATLSAPNQQQSLGADVVSRIQYELTHPDKTAQRIVQNQLRQMIAVLTEACGCQSIKKTVVAGNTAMLHFLLGKSPEGLSAFPFFSLTEQSFRLSGEKNPLPGEETITLPCPAPYIGADIAADILHFRLMEETGNTLMIDLGTNGEIVLSKGGELFCCSAAAGPAFEGANISCGVGGISGGIHRLFLKNGQLTIETIDEAPPIGLCGSGAIDLLQILLQAGILDNSGRIRPLAALDSAESMKLHRRLVKEDCIFVTPHISLSQKDIRELQLAKAAVRAGVQLLLQEAGVEKPDRVILTGGLGTHLNPENAAAIELFDPAWLPCTEAAESGALKGAVQCCDEHILAAAANIRCHGLELSAHPDFQDIFLRSLSF